MHVASVRRFELARGLVCLVLGVVMAGCSEHRQPAIADGPVAVVHERFDGLTVGSAQICARDARGKFRCWDSAHNNVWEAPPRSYSLVDMGEPVALAAGAGFICALSAAGEVQCQKRPGEGVTPAPARIGFRHARQISATLDQVCALEDDGTVACSGCLYPPCPDTAFAGVMQVQGISKAVEIVAKRAFGCAVLDDRTVRCWANTREGPIATPPHGEIKEVVALTDVHNIALGGLHWCAALEDGTAACVGENGSGQLGGDDPQERGAPVPVVGLTGVIRVTTTNLSSCALVDDGRVHCWGFNQRGDVGDGTSVDRARPVLVTGLDEVEELASDGFLQTCARRRDTSVWCWGNGSFSPLRLPD